ncbi:hypothetical protein [Cryobacterium sp. HLT2-28]|uniref:hypothetical protein n=1 Tax=Cryobacterium sp. HLT2-28 TaxID=1259146 RepID=UPI00106BC1AA|nr:hypothetical protein [Cryobacterium sp. HLT2-28]TFB94548.1 hypothetical protein E3O48_08015 [Cryobacterium sp. HLT2-28]
MSARAFRNVDLHPDIDGQAIKGLNGFEVRHRQIVFSSHNANIPVLGDADQIVALAAEDTPNGVVGYSIQDGLGSIDHAPVRQMVEEILEGGRDAFNTRRYLYGF